MGILRQTTTTLTPPFAVRVTKAVRGKGWIIPCGTVLTVLDHGTGDLRNCVMVKSPITGWRTAIPRTHIKEIIR